MSYGKVLQKMIKEKNISFKELSAMCKEEGKSIDPSYISKLVNERSSAPSDEVSKIIAKVLEDDEQKLTIEANLEKTPELIMKFIKKIRHSTMLPTIEKIRGTLSDNQMESFRTYLDEQPISEFILDIVNSEYSVSSNSMILRSETNKINISISQPIGLPINDDSMEPIIPKNSTVSFNNKVIYSNGDIVGFIPNNEQRIILRKYYVKEDTIIFVPENKKYEPSIYKKSEINIVGKIDKIIVKV
jgi:transcriptional regulator with XRE-family HTH domain